MPGSRRLVLVDFDWDDAELVPALLRQPGVSVGLVAGQRPEDAGMRLAELCDLPRTFDLTDLTRQLFALALVSDRSPRRAHVESLLRAMGTPSQTPQGFLGQPAGGQAPPPPEETFDLAAALRLQAEQLDDALGPLDDARGDLGALDDEHADLGALDDARRDPNEPSAARPGWLEPAEFLGRVEQAARRHVETGHPLALDRFDLPRSSMAGDRFAERLPDRVRRTDSLCRPEPSRILLLTGASRERFPFLRARLLAQWEEAWLAAENAHPAPGLLDQRIELTRADEAAAFVARARLWSELSTT
jgi:hypothetical protein